MNAAIKEKWTQLRVILPTLGLTQPEIALAAGVSQAAVSRILAKCPDRTGQAFKKICIYAEARLPETQRALPLPIEEESLVSAINEVWNGTPEHARALAEMIRAAGFAARVSIG
jgi:predicted transcriptional regulator